MAELPILQPSMTFAEACDAVVDYLKSTIPMGYWSVSRYDGTNQVYLAVRDDSYGKVAGDSHPWSDSLCQYAVTGEAPQIAPDAMTVPLYAGAGVSRQLAIGAYIGIPIRRLDGALFGTLCGLDPEVHDAALEANAPLLGLLSSLLSTILEADLARTEQARRLEEAESLAETDPLTGLVNRRGWERHIDREEERYRRFGDPAAVIMIDLDRLKEINDRLGHSHGDDYIRRAATVLRSAVRKGDLVARLGGDEFGVLASQSPPGETDTLVSRLRNELLGAGVAGSIGHAPYTFVAGFPGAWEAADAAMYEDKRQRRRLPLAEAGRAG